MIKRSSSFILAAGLAACPVTAFAQGISAGVSPADPGRTSRDLLFEGTAPAACVTRAPRPVVQQNAAVTVSDNGNIDIRLDKSSFINPVTGVPNPVVIQVAFPIVCNTAHKISVESLRGGLQNEAVANGAFALRSHLDFNVQMNWAGTTKSFDTASGRAFEMPVMNAATGDADIRIAIPGGGTPLVAGVYSDTITLKVEVTS